MIIHIPSWIFSFFVSIVILAWVFIPRASDHDKYSLSSAFRIVAGVIMLLVVWLVWAISRINLLSW